MTRGISHSFSLSKQEFNYKRLSSNRWNSAQSMSHAIDTEQETDENFWKDCTTWLIICGVLPANSPAKQPEATAVDLFQALRNGDILCHLVCKLDPKALTEEDFISRHYHMPEFQCKRNIETFLNACQNHFGLKRSDLFKPVALLQTDNFNSEFQQVLHTLHRLSQTKQAQELTSRCSIPKQNDVDNVTFNINCHPIENPLTNGYEEDPESPSSEDSSPQSSLAYYDPVGGEEDCIEYEHVYEPVVTEIDSRIKELLKTESDHIKVLNTISIIFTELYRHRPMDEFQQLQETTQQLLQIHNELNDRLNQNDDIDNIVSAFNSIQYEFLKYGTYIFQKDRVVKQVNTLLSTYRTLRLTIQKIQQDNFPTKCSLTEDLMVRPIQRITKYHLFIKGLMKKMRKDDQSYQNLEQVRDGLDQVLKSIEASQIHYDDLENINDIKNVVDIDSSKHNQVRIDIEFCGKLIKDGEMKVNLRPYDKKIKTMHVILFTKRIFICEITKGSPRYVLVKCLPLNNYTIGNISSQLNVKIYWNHKILLTDEQNGSTIELLTKTAFSKQEWIKSFTEAIKWLFPPGGIKSNHKFECQSYNTPTKCSGCSKLLLGLSFQGYSCLQCNAVAHQDCLGSIAECTNVIEPLPERNRSAKLMSQMNEHLWYAGDMNRTNAEKILRNANQGTFLVRHRKSDNSDVIFSISLRTRDSTKHLRINFQSSCITKCWLSPIRSFTSIPKLVQWYMDNSLQEAFSQIDTILVTPWKRAISTAIVRETYQENEEATILLSYGQHVVLIDADYKSSGWAKIDTGNEVAFIPKKLLLVDNLANR